MDGEDVQINPLIADDDILNDCGPVEIPPPPAPVQALDATGPRMIITKIVTENFKSYGGVRVMGPFHKNFSCIIGPNGSGKSNVIDSMLFVFGYRASKVRSKKLSQLIHESELIPNAKSCMVAVHFEKIIDNGPGATDFEVVPNSGFVVSRRAYRDNSSSYWIDDSRAVYKDVANLLRLHGIDLDHNRFLILQGEVEQIALMKPKAPSEHEDGFLEYLEDIIGSSRFKIPLNIFADRIERLNDLRLEKLARVKAVEKEKDELEGVRNEAMGYLRLVNQVIRMKNVLFQQHLAKERGIESDTKKKLSDAQTEVQSLASEVKTKSRELAQLESERDDLNQRHSQLQIRHRDAKAKFSEFEAQDSRLRDEHAHTKAAGRRLTKAIQAERAKLEELERLPSEADARRQAIQAQLDELDETKKRHEEAYKETVDNLAKETAPLRLKVEAAEAALAPLQAEADDISSKLTLEQQQYDLVMAGQRRELERAEKAQKSADEAKSKLADRERMLAEAKAKLQPNSGGGRGSGAAMGGLKMALGSASRDLNEVKTRETDLTKELNQLRTKLVESKSAMQADNSRGAVLKALLEAKRSGTMPGILGRLGDLAAIPPRYDIAISTACAALDNIVTDTMDTAQKAVNFLKQNNLGQATFIGLDKMTKWADKAAQPFQSPKGPFQVERLYDLVETVDPSIRPAFYYALRDTLVTDSLDSATKIAFGQRQRFRVVTLQGQLIETSGAMSGGGNKPLSGRMLTNLAKAKEMLTATRQAHQSSDSVGHGRGSIGPDSRVKDLAALEKQLAEGDAELGRLRDTRSRLEEVVTRLTHQIDEAERTMKRCETECSRLRAEVEALTTEAHQAQTRAKSLGPSESERKKLEADLNKLQQVAKQKCDKAAKKRQESEDLKAQLLDVGSARLTAVRSRLDAIEKKTKETQDQLTKLEVSVKTATRNKQKAEAKLAGMEAELETMKTSLADIDAKLKQLEEDARSCMTEFQQIQAEVEELQKNKEESQTKLSILEEALATAQKSEANARRQVGQLEADLAQAVARARQWERELRNLRLHRIEDDDDEEEEEDGEIKSSQQSQSQDAPASSQVDSSNSDLASPSQSAAPIKKPLGRPKSTDLPRFPVEKLREMSVDTDEMHEIEQRIASMAPNMAAIEEYRRKAEIYLTRVGELNHVTTLLGDQRRQMDDAKAKRLSEFLDGFHLITAKLKEMYQMITQGGDAELELIDSLDPFSEGIVFSVRPPKKTWKNIANLSGGEKTLSSLALVFALHHYKPTPLYVMDEIDAALDFKNVSIVGNYLKERTKNAQFIVISLRNNMFELSDRLVGIYKTFNITKTITLDPMPLMDHLRSLVVRVATAHGREQDLQRDHPDLGQTNQFPVGAPRPQPFLGMPNSQPMHGLELGLADPVPISTDPGEPMTIKLSPDSPVPQMGSGPEELSQNSQC